MEERIIQLEKIVAHQGCMIDELNSVIVDQTEQVAQMERRFDQFLEQYKQDNLVKDIEEEEPPPHY